MDGCPIEELGFDFTLPGYPGIELRKGGRDMTVTLDNLVGWCHTSCLVDCNILWKIIKKNNRSVLSMNNECDCWHAKQTNRKCEHPSSYYVQGQYVSLVSHWMLIEGVSTQMEAVREGFNSVFPITSLQMFYPGMTLRLALLFMVGTYCPRIGF